MSDTTTIAPEKTKITKKDKKVQQSTTGPQQSTAPQPTSPAPQPPAPAPVPALDTKKRSWKDTNIGKKRELGTRPPGETMGERDKPEGPTAKKGLSQVKGAFEKGPKSDPVDPNEGYVDLPDGWDHKAKTTRSVETEGVKGGRDGITTRGIKTEKTREDIKGDLSSYESETRTGDTTKKVSVQAMEGAQAKLEETLVKYDNGDIIATFDAIARTGAFGEAAAEGAKKMGPYTLWGKANASGGAGIETSLGGKANIQKNGRFRYEIALALEGAIKAGVWGKAGVEAGIKRGPAAMKFFAEIEGWAGAKAEFKTEAFATKAKGIGAELEAKAAAGAGVSGRAGAALDLGPLGFDVEVFGEAFAGAEAAFKGGFHVGLNHIAAEFEASAFAGARASAGAKGGIRIRGRQIVSVKGEISVYAGVGGKVKGKFASGIAPVGKSGEATKLGTGVAENGKDYEHIEGGKWKGDKEEVKAPFELKSTGKLEFGGALAGALGLGAGVEVDGSFDYGSLAELITAELYEMSRSAADKKYDLKGAQFEREDLPADSPMAKRFRARGHNAVFSTLKEYNEKKMSQGDHGVKEGAIRKEIMNCMVGQNQYFAYKEFDRGVEDAIYEAFKGQVTKVVIDGGSIQELVVVHPESDEAKAYRDAVMEEQGWADARDKLINAFVDYASEVEKSSGKGAAEKSKVQEIIDKHRPNIEKAFAKKGSKPKNGKMLVTDMTATVGEVVSHAAQQSGITRYFLRWGVGASGRISSDTIGDPGAANKIRADYQQGKKINKVIGKLYDAKAKLDAMVSEKVADEKTPFISRVWVDEIIRDTLGEVDPAVKKDHEYNTRLRQILVESLKGHPDAPISEYLFDTSKFSVVEGRLGEYRPSNDGLQKLRERKKKDALNAAKKQAFGALVSDVASYKEKKLKQGDHGVQIERLNAMITDRVGSLGKIPGVTWQSLHGDIKSAVEEGLGIESKEDDPSSGIKLSKLGFVHKLPDAWSREHSKEKAETKEHGRATVRGDANGELNNTRRQLVHGVVRGPLDKIRANFDRLMLGELTDDEIEASYYLEDDDFQAMVTPTADGLKTEIQGVIQKLAKKHKADVHNKVARDAIIAEIKSRFGDVLKDPSLDDDLTLKADEVGGWKDDIEKKLLGGRDEKRAVEKLHDEVKDLWVVSKRESTVQEILDGVYQHLGADNAARDEKALKIIKAALPRVTFGKDFTVKGGKLQNWKVIGS